MKRYRIELKSSAAKSLDKLPVDLQKRIVRAMDVLSDNPRPAGVVKMVGDDDLWRLRVGDFRIVYEIHDDVLLVLVLRIGHRREVYRGD